MHVRPSSPGVLGPQCGQCPGLTTRDGVRQETPGALVPGLEVKAAEKLSSESEGRRRRPSLIHRLRISVLTEGGG
jgi:hypothetical protein